MEEKNTNTNTGKFPPISTDAYSIMAFSPMIVPVSENENENQFIERLKKNSALPPEKKYILSSEITIQKLEDIQKKYNLSTADIANVSRLVRFIVWDEVKISDAGVFLKRYIQNISEDEIVDINKNITEILSQTPVEEPEIKSEPKPQSNTKKIQISIMEALQRYPKSGEQLITTNLIKLRIFPTPVRPSIKNWITDYHDFVGSGSHNAVDRGNYLFQSANGKSLTPMERQRVSDMLKAIDQNENVSVDVEKETIVFAATSGEAAKAPGAKGDAYVTKMHSSSGPTMQSESSQKTELAGGEQEDVFDRYAKKSFSPNFANKQEFVVSKRKDMQKSVEEFRKAAVPVAEEAPVFHSHGTEGFHDLLNIPKKKEEDQVQPHISFSTPQVFSAERKKETAAPKPVPHIRPKPKPQQLSHAKVASESIADLQSVPEQKPAEQPKRIAATYRQSWHIAPSSFSSSDLDDKI